MASIVPGAGHLRPQVNELRDKVERLLKQQPRNSHKLYSLHAPEVEYLGKGKVRQPYEFGVKVPVATTHKEGLVVGMQSLPGNPCDGHTLHAALEQVKNLTAVAEGSVRGARLSWRATVPLEIKVYHRKLKRGITARLKRDVRRRSPLSLRSGT